MKSQVKKEGAGPKKRTQATKKAMKKAGSAKQNTQRGKELTGNKSAMGRAMDKSQGISKSPSSSPHAKSSFNKKPTAKLQSAGKNNSRTPKKPSK
jgi:hypothetical protein